MALGALLEATQSGQKGLKKLMSLAPDEGRKMQANMEIMVPVESIQSGGDYLRILRAVKQSL